LAKDHGRLFRVVEHIVSSYVERIVDASDAGRRFESASQQRDAKSLKPELVAINNELVWTIKDLDSAA